MSRRLSATLAAVLVLALAAASAASSLVPPGAAELRDHVDVLAAPEMEGRGSATPGAERAAWYIASALAASGLRPGGDAGTFFQEFSIGTDSLRPAADVALAGVGPASRDLAVGREWLPHGGSRSGEVTGEVVFVGAGLPEAGRDDYAGADLGGRIALALDDPAGAARPASRLDKVIAARRAGAAALLIATDALPAVSATSAAVSLVSASLTRDAADALLAPSGRRLADLATAGPAPMATGVFARIRVGLERADRRTANVIGILPGTDPALAGEAVVIGAHYDHLGRQRGIVHPGADDNASGTAVVLGLARAAAAAGGMPRTLVFALFSGEELGLLGSGYYVRHPAVPLDRTVAMLNFDMVGRMRDDRLTVSGVESGSGLRAVASRAVAAERLTGVLRDGPLGPSDHARFYTGGVPVLFFHTGSHGDYHRPSDTADRVDAPGMARVAGVAARILVELAGGARPTYVSLPSSGRADQGGSGSGARGEAFLGVGGDGREDSDGVPLRSVMAGRAAARAGLRDGDVLVRIGDVPVNSFDELRAAIRLRKPGDTVRIVFLRAGEDQVTSATLGARP
jgi:hypothetical protein